MKTWKTKAIYNYYEDASQIKNLLLENDESGFTRIKNSGGPIFQRRLSGRGSLIGFDYKNKDNPFFSPPH